MFKSCFPNSNLGGNPDDPPVPSADNFSDLTVAHAKRIYLDLLNYFAAHPEKLFVVITAPPLRADDTTPEQAANARAFNNWLMSDWLNGHPHANVAVFDFYNVLTSNGGDPDTNDLGAATGGGSIPPVPPTNCESGLVAWHGALTTLHTITLTFAVTVTANTTQTIVNTAAIAVSGRLPFTRNAVVVVNGYGIYLSLMLKGT